MTNYAQFYAIFADFMQKFRVSCIDFHQSTSSADTGKRVTATPDGGLRMAKKSKNAVKSKLYRQRLAERHEPSSRKIDIELAKALAVVAAEAAETQNSGLKKFLNGIFKRADEGLKASGFDGVKSAEVIKRRSNFHVRLAAKPDASPRERKAWLPPLKSNLPKL